MTENKEIIKAGGVFITHRTREAIYATAAQRTEPELKECFTMLHDSMDRFGKQIAVEEITGQDFIIYTPERRIRSFEPPTNRGHEIKNHFKGRMYKNQRGAGIHRQIY